LKPTVSINDAPASDELEVSVFGPGFGECVVVHLGDGKWMVVDSCLNDSRTEPIALEYLKSLNVDVASQIKLIVVTHWHDDHIRGSGELFCAADSARFVCSAALNSKEFFGIVAASEQVRSVTRDSSASEILTILRENHRRKGRGTTFSQSGPDQWAQDGSPLYRSSGCRNVAVTALSPSAQTITDAAANFAKLLPSVSEQNRRFPRCSPNDQSVALIIESETSSILLGADLEAVSDPERGWQAILNSPLRPQVKCGAIKLAHHGSGNGDHDGIWSALLKPEPLSFVTPFTRGKKPLPSEADIRRLKSRTPHLYCTAWPPSRKPPRRHRSVERTIRAMTKMHRAVPRSVGQIRLRVSMNDDRQPTIATFNGAARL